MKYVLSLLLALLLSPLFNLPASSQGSVPQAYRNEITRRIVAALILSSHQVGPIMRRQGFSGTMVRIQFSVTPDGKINVINVSSSPHVPSIHRVLAGVVRKAGPFQLPAHGPKRTHYFSQQMRFNG